MEGGRTTHSAWVYVGLLNYAAQTGGLYKVWSHLMEMLLCDWLQVA